jgi:hypothetical protein
MINEKYKYYARSQGRTYKEQKDYDKQEPENRKKEYVNWINTKWEEFGRYKGLKVPREITKSSVEFFRNYNTEFMEWFDKTIITNYTSSTV